MHLLQTNYVLTCAISGTTSIFTTIIIIQFNFNLL